MFRQGFTLVEGAAVVVLLGGLCAAVAVGGTGARGHGPPRKRGGVGGGDAGETGLLGALIEARGAARQEKDATQVRGIVQAMVISAQSNQGAYPLPSKLDTENQTVAAAGRAKDTTANIFSYLIYNGFISTDLCVSPAEVNRRVRVCDKYEFTGPKSAATPAGALWDPGFRCDFLRDPGGNVSYAHLQPSGSRLSIWRDTYATTEAVLGNRGPAIATAVVEEVEGAPGGMRSKVTLRKEKSKTFRIHGPDGSREGNIAYNDGHVNFEAQYAPEGRTYHAAAKDAEGKDAVKVRPDVLFFDEKDAKDGVNIYLGIWRRAGEKAEQFGGIWD